MEIGRSLGMTMHRQLRINDSFRARALERLSSGLRINRAADDAAGLSISETMRAQIRGTAQAMRNAQDGISMIRTAEGAFSSIHDVLQRMRELCVQGANGSLVLADRLAIQAELDELKKQIDTTAYFTTFNGHTLLVDEDKAYNANDMPYTYNVANAPIGAWSPGRDAAAQTLIGGPGGSVNGVTWEELQAVEAQMPSLIEGALRKAEGMIYSSGLDQTTLVPPDIYFVIDNVNPSRFTATNVNTLVVNLYAFLGSGVPGATPQITLQQAVTQGLSDILIQREDANSTGGGDYSAFFIPSGDYDNMRQIFTVGAAESYIGYGAPAAFQFDALDADGGRAAAAWFSRYLLDKYGSSALEEMGRIIVDDDTATKANMTAALDTYLTGLTGLASRAAVEADVVAYIAANPAVGPGTVTSLSNTSDTRAEILSTPTKLQIGANASEVMDLTLYAGALGNLDFAALVAVTDQQTASRSLETLDKAIAIVSDARSGLGASENRLEHTLTRLGTYLESEASAESRIRDADMAEEYGILTRGQIMVQASIGTLQIFHSLQNQRVGQILEGLSDL